MKNKDPLVAYGIPLVYGIPSLAVSAAIIFYSVNISTFHLLATLQHPIKWLEAIKMCSPYFVTLPDAKIVKRLTMLFNIMGAVFIAGAVCLAAVQADNIARGDVTRNDVVLLTFITTSIVLNFGCCFLNSAVYFEKIFDVDTFVNVSLRPTLPADMANSASSHEVLNCFMDYAAKKANIAFYMAIGFAVAGIFAITIYEDACSRMRSEGRNATT